MIEILFNLEKKKIVNLANILKEYQDNDILDELINSLGYKKIMLTVRENIKLKETQDAIKNLFKDIESFKNIEYISYKYKNDLKYHKTKNLLNQEYNEIECIVLIDIFHKIKANIKKYENSLKFSWAKQKKYDSFEYDIIKFKKLTKEQFLFEYLLEINNNPFLTNHYTSFEEYKSAKEKYLECCYKLDSYCKKFEIKRNYLTRLKYKDTEFNNIKIEFKKICKKKIADLSIKNVVYLIYIDEKLVNKNNYSLILPFYVGQTSKPISKRFSEHKTEIEKSLDFFKTYGIHSNDLRYSLYDKMASFLYANGLDTKDLKVTIIEHVSVLEDSDANKKELYSREHFHIKKLKAYKYGFNATPFIENFYKIDKKHQRMLHKREPNISLEQKNEIFKQYFLKYFLISKEEFKDNLNDLVGFGYFKLNIESLSKIYNLMYNCFNNCESFKKYN